MTTMTVLHPGDSPVVQTTIKKRDGTVMDLTGGTVTYTFVKPATHGKVDKTATVSNPTTGVATYHLLTADIAEDEVGLWQIFTKVVIGADQFRSVSPIQFKVEANP